MQKTICKLSINTFEQTDEFIDYLKSFIIPTLSKIVADTVIVRSRDYPLCYLLLNH